MKGVSLSYQRNFFKSYFLIYLAYVKEKQKTDGKLFYLWVQSPHVSDSHTGSGRSLESGNHSGSPTGMVGTQAAEPCSVVSQRVHEQEAA